MFEQWRYSTNMIDQRLVELALDEVNTADFERFGQSFFGSLQDRDFIPLTFLANFWPRPK